MEVLTKTIMKAFGGTEQCVDVFIKGYFCPLDHILS
jgi:hypothetical protein